MPHVVHDYAENVCTGKIIAGPYVRDTCKRHLADLERAKRKEDGLWFCDEAAAHVIQFFERRLRLNTGEYEGSPFLLFDWQYFVLGSLFGWKIGEYRRFRNAYLEIGKGAGKSPLAGGVGLYMLGPDKEPRAEIYAAAHNQDQAKIIFRTAVAMVEQNPFLQSKFSFRGKEVKTQINHNASGSFFRPISTERQGKGKSGPIPHLSLLDELHEHPTDAMVDMLRLGRKNRRQPLTFMITNSGSDKETVCWDYHELARRVAEGVVTNDRFFSYVCANDDGDDPMVDESIWPKTNPSLPAIPGYDFIREEVAEARNRPLAEGRVRRLVFCEWSDLGGTKWLTRKMWESCLDKDIKIDQFKGFTAYGGLDIAIRGHLTAFNLLFFDLENGRYVAFPYFWCAGGRVQELDDLYKLDGRFVQWVEDGLIRATPDKNSTDFEDVAKFIDELYRKYDFDDVAVDPNKLPLVEQELEDIDSEVNLIKHPQGFRHSSEWNLYMPDSIAHTEAMIHDSELVVEFNPVMNWCVTNTNVVPSPWNDDDVRFVKGDGDLPNDGSLALAQSVGLAKEGVQRTYGEDDDLLVIRGN